jgi:hypothetical protein
MAPVSSSVDTEKTKRSRIPSTRVCDVVNDAELALSSHREARNQAQRAHDAEAVSATLASSTATTSTSSRKRPSASVAGADEDNDVIEVISELRDTSEGKSPCLQVLILLCT